jgi:hypothetical protein
VRPLDDANAIWPAHKAAKPVPRQHRVLLRGATSAPPRLRRSAENPAPRTGKRKQLFSGMGSYLYMLALLRSDDPSTAKPPAPIWKSPCALGRTTTAIHQQIDLLRQIRAGAGSG